MNKPTVSLDTLTRLEAMERDRALEKVLRGRGFGGSDLIYEEIDGEARLLISKDILCYMAAHKGSIKQEIEEAFKAASIKALEAGMAIIELQKIGGLA
jgi:hypothetical protein